jgi:hypothetical protein
VSDIIALYDLRVSVDVTGCRTRLFKFPVKFTGKNYISISVTEELRDQGFTKFGMIGRVKQDEIMQVRRGSLFQNDHVDRKIYFIEGQKEEAIQKLISAMDEQVSMMKRNAELIYEAWTTRKDSKK